jgi:DNA helicase-2/ATP-dependent DNA helicase PcrA
MDYLAVLNEQQRQAVLHGEGPAMVLAGAGSGKTRVLVTRVAYLLEDKNLNPENILLLTFTNKAAGEMQSRVSRLTGKQLPFAGTFHKLGARILRSYGSKLGYPENYVIYDSDDQLSLIKLVMKDLDVDPKQYHHKAILGSISSAKQQLIGPEEYQQFARGQFQEIVGRIYQIYERRLKMASALDFDNLLTKTIELLRMHTDVREYFQEMFQYVLIDEYQDTNHAQYVLTKLLMQPQNNLFVVGDASQAIYGWRGADYRNMLNLKLDFAGMEEYRLEQNYRSTPCILQAASGVIQNNQSHPVLELWTENDDFDKITLMECHDGREEAKRVAKMISQLIDDLNEVAVLYRTNAQSRELEEALLRLSIPYRLVGGVKFYSRKEVKDVLAYLSLVHQPENEVALLRATRLGKRRLAAFLAWREKYHQSDTQLTTPEILDQLLAATYYTEKYNEKDPEDLSRLENIQELKSVATQFPDLTEFLEQVALVENDQLGNQGQPDQPAVTLMSLHAAKGLEFNTVFLVGMEEGLFPHSRSLLERDQLEEERRLCYVGITRARRKLIMSHAKQRFVFGTPQRQLPSRFIREIPAKLLENLASDRASDRRSNNGHQKTNPNRAMAYNLDDPELEAVLSGEVAIDDWLHSA